MKKLLAVLGAGLLAFSVSLVGTYLAMPYIAPHIVAQANQPDSSAAPDSLHPRQQLMALLDSLNTHDPTALFAKRGVVDRLRDSLATLNDSLASVDTRTATLSEQLQMLQTRVSTLEAARANAAEISKSLTDMDLREMRAVLAPLDLQTYEAIYEQVEGRDRTRFLQALPPDKAAQLVDRIVARN